MQLRDVVTKESSADLLFDIKDEVEYCSSETHADKMQQLVIQRQRMTEVRETKQRKGYEDEEGEDQEPLVCFVNIPLEYDTTNDVLVVIEEASHTSVCGSGASA